MKNLKKETNFSTEVVLIGLNFIVAKGIPMVAIHISKA